MSDDRWVRMAWTIVLVTGMMLFPAGRKALAGLLGLAWKGVAALATIAGNQGQAFLLDIWKAHMTVFRNFLPRNAVLPSVRQDTVRRS